MIEALKMGVLLALGVLGVVAYQYQQRQLRESPFLQKLNSLIQRKEFGAVTQRLADRAPTVDKSESRLIATWLKGHAVDGDFPALYFTSLCHTKQGRLEEAGRWFSAAARWGLEYDGKHKGRPAAGWIAKHGIKAFSGNVQYVPDADWQAARSHIRAEFEKSIAAN